MKIVAVIPSRYESSRFEGKPLAKICGKPMIQWVYEGVQNANVSFSDVVVATDDQRIVDAVSDFGGTAVMTSQKHRSGSDRIAEAVEIMGLSLDDMVINIQGDQPLMNPKCLDELILPFMEEPGIVMSTLAYAITDPSERTNPKDVKVVMDSDGFALYFSRASIPWGRDNKNDYDMYKHLGFYAYKRRFLEIFRSLPEGRLEGLEKLEQLRALEFGHKIKVVVTSYDSPEVDLPEDIDRIETILKNSEQ